MGLSDVVVATSPLEHCDGIERSMPTVRPGLAAALCETMSLQRLIERYADSIVPIEFSLEKIYRPRPGLNGGSYLRRLMSLADAARMMASFAHRPYGCYISNFNADALDRMISQIIPEEIRRPDGPKPDTALFIGSDGSGSHWHYDATDNFVLALDGAKEVHLKPPGALKPHPILSACRSFAKDKDVPHHASPIILERGDSLFLPSGWWHMIRNRGNSVSLTVIYPTQLRKRLGWPYLRVQLSRALVGLQSRARRNRGASAAGAGSAYRRPAGAQVPAPRYQGVRAMPTEPPAHSNGAEPFVLVVRGEQLSLSDVFSAARRLGRLDFVEAVAKARILRAIAAERGVSVSDEMLQQAADAFRRAKGLHAPDDTHRWLAANFMTLDDFEAYLESLVLSERVLASFTRKEVQALFDGIKDRFGAVVMRSTIVGEEPLAVELAAMIEEGAASFEELASRFSNDRCDQLSRGRLTRHYRHDLPKDVADELFTADIGTVFPPALGDAGWMVQRLEERDEPRLDPETERRIRLLLLETLTTREGYYWHGSFAQAQSL